VKRLFTFGVVSLALAGAACDRGQSAAAASPASTSSPAAAAAPSDGTPAAAATTATPATGSALAEPAGAAPAAREVTIPAGTQLAVTLDTTLGSDVSRVEEPVVAHLTRPLVIHGDTVLPAGSRVGGVVTDATRSGKVKGRAHLAVRFDSIVSGSEGTRYRIAAPAIGRTAAATKQKDAMKIGAPAAGGALIGAIAGGKKGALIGTAIGGGAGTAVVMSTRGEEVRLPKGTALTLKLSQPLTVKVRG
jgi:hypothetical protein